MHSGSATRAVTPELGAQIFHLYLEDTYARHVAMHPGCDFSISDDDSSFDYNISSDDEAGGEAAAEMAEDAVDELN